MSSTSFSSGVSARSVGLPFSRHFESERARDAAACALLAALSVFFPWQLSLRGFLPNSIDFLLQYYPNLAFLGRSLRAGEIPLWNPHVFAGTPYLADPQSAVLYFPNWPFLLMLDTADAARAIIVAHYALAAVAFYLYLRAIHLSPAPSLLGAVAFGLSPYTIRQVAGIPLLINLAWIPVELLFVEKALQRRSVGYVLAAAVAVTLQLFNGWLHGLYVASFALLATLLYHALSAGLAAHNWRPAARATGLMALTGAVAAALGSVLLLPALEFASQSNYLMDRGLEQAGGEGNVTVLAVLGVGGSEGHGAYLGILGLVLVLLGVLHGSNRKRTWLYVLLGGFALLAAFGTKAPLYRYLYDWIPGFKAFHTPGRFMVLYLISASALAAFGADAVLRGAGWRQAVTATGLGALLLGPFYYTMSRMFAPEAFGQLANNLINWGAGPFLRAETARQIFFSGVAAGLFLLALGYRRLPRRGVYGAALLLMAADLFLIQGTDSSYFASPPSILSEANSIGANADGVGGTPGYQEGAGQAGGALVPWWLSPDFQQELKAGADESEFRVMGYARNGTSHFLSDFPNNLTADLMPPNMAMIYGFDDVQGYNPLQLRRYAQYVAAINGGPEDYHWAFLYNLQSRLLDLLNVRYVAIRGNDSRVSDVTIATALNLETTGDSLTVRPKKIRASGLQVESYLGHSAELENGTVAARLRVTDTAGNSWSFDLRAGIETAEWAYDRPDVLAKVKHQRARIAETWNLPSPVHTYVADIQFPQPIEIAQVTLERAQPDIFIVVPEIAAVPSTPVQRYQEVGEYQGTTVYRNQLALPRALLVPRAEVVTDETAVLDRLTGDDFDPRQTVILEGAGLPSHQGGSQPVGDVEIVSESDNGAQLLVRAESPGFLLLNELSYPGWNAYLDGQRVRVWRANYLFRAIEVGPGEHSVEFRYEPDSLKLGLALSLPTLALLAAAAVFRLKTRKRRKENVSP